MPAEVTPIASTTAIAPSGMASIAARVEVGDDHDSGVARSSRAGTKRRVKAGPTMRSSAWNVGRGPCIQVRRTPFFSRMVVIVPVEVARSASRIGWARIMERSMLAKRKGRSPAKNARA